MRSKKTATHVAILGGVASFFLIAWLMRFHAWLPLVGAGVTSIALLAILRPPRERPAPPLPDGVEPKVYEEAIARLSAGVDCLHTYASAAPPADAPLFQRMAQLLDQVRAHHVANPGHAGATRVFIRHVLGRMLSQVADYLDLVQRAGPEEADRLAEISRSFEGFVPVLEKIDRACIENDLTELEINVEVLSDQLDRNR